MYLATDRKLMTMIYRALVRESLLPIAASVIGRAALDAIARRAGAAAADLPTDFGEDLDRDATFLERALPDPGPWWDVFTAMAWDGHAAHTAVTDTAFATGMQARLRGEPLAAPGFFLWRQADGRLAIADRDGARQRVRMDLASTDVACVTEQRLDGGVGHLRVRWFATSNDPRQDVGSLARRAVEALVADGAPGLVIDVRSGLGGQLSAANAILSLLSDATVVGAHRYEDGTVSTHERNAPVAWPGAPVAVLMNEQTISAAEYLALGLEELAGAVLVGTVTAGGLNGLRFLDLADGYRLALPHGTTIGPRSRAARPGFRLQPHVHAANPTVRDLAAVVDPALETARCAVLGHPWRA